MISLYVALLALSLACLLYTFRDSLRKLLRLALYNSTKLKDDSAELDLESLEFGNSAGYGVAGAQSGSLSVNRKRASYDEARRSMTYTDNSYLYSNINNIRPAQYAAPPAQNSAALASSSQADTLPRPMNTAPKQGVNHYYNAPPPMQAQPLPRQHPLAQQHAMHANRPAPFQAAPPPAAMAPPPPPPPPAEKVGPAAHGSSGLEAFTMGVIPSLQLRELQLQHVLGGGAFGQVWQGSWQGTPVAVKVLSTACQSQALPRQVLSAFEDEVKMLASLRHPNVCLFLAACLDPPNRAIVTELVTRGSLWDALRQPGLLAGAADGAHWPAWAMRRVLDGTCRGLVYLHSHQPPIIHRDLKSANLLLDDSFNVKICDFGLARLRDYTAAMTANVGTVQWMAPEILSGQAYSEAADIYSIGIIAWEILTGKCPYEGQSHIDVALAVVHKHARPDLPLSCPAGQADLLRRCWSHAPLHRPSAAEALASVAASF